MSDEEFSKGYDAGYDTARRLEFLEEQLKGLTEMVGQFQEDLMKISQRVARLERPKMPADEALKLYDMLKQSINPSLTLADFAEEYGLSYNTLRQARSRGRRKKEP